MLLSGRDLLRNSAAVPYLHTTGRGRERGSWAPLAEEFFVVDDL